MPDTLYWTNARDTQLRRLRAEGATWGAIADALFVSRFTAIERGRRIGAPRPPAVARVPQEDASREALPAGHPRSWSAITAGTVLEGAPYPLPCFIR